MLSFAAYWVGSNAPICLHLQFEHHKNLLAKDKAYWLQRKVGLLIDADPENVKIFLGSPTGPQLTPVLWTTSILSSARTRQEEVKHVKTKQEAVKKAWAELEAMSSNVVNVYVTQHAAADVAVDKLVHASFSNHSDGVYYTMSSEVRDNPKVLVAVIRCIDWRFNIKIPLALSQSKQFVLALAKECCNHKSVLQYAHPDLQKDKNFVLAVIAHHGENIRFAARELLDDRDVVLAAIHKSGMYFKTYAMSFANDREVVLAAVASFGYALADVPPVFRNDKEVVLAALYSCYGKDRKHVLQFASPALQQDSDVLALIN